MGLSSQLKVDVLASVSAEALSNVLWTSVVPFVFKCLLILLYTVFIVNFSVFVISPISAAAPAITGSWGGQMPRWDVTVEFVNAGVGTGAYLLTQRSHTGCGTTSASKGTTVTFDASRCSTIYGNADTVLPESYSTRYFIKF